MLTAVWRYLMRHPWRYLLIAVVLVIYDFSLVLPTQVIQRLIDALTKANLTRMQLWNEVGLLVAATLVSYLSSYLWNTRLFQSAIGFKFDLQAKSFRKLISMRQAFYDKFRSGDMVTRFSSDAEYLEEFAGYGLMIVLYGGGLIAFVIPVMFAISWQISLWAMTPLLFLVWFFWYFGKKQDQSIEDNREAVASLNNEVLEVVEGIRVTRAYGRKAELAQQFHKHTERLVDLGNTITRFQSAYGPVSTAMLGLSTAIILGLGAHYLLAGHITLGQIIALQLYVVSLVEPFVMLADLIIVYQTATTSYRKIEELIETSDDMEPDGLLQCSEFETLSFKDYSFAYPMAERSSLQEISFELSAGQTLGIVGKTGAGKTTLIRQLLRQYPLGSGQLLLNQVPILDYQRASIDQLLGYVPQEHVLFSKPVGANIALGKVGSQEEEIRRAVALASFSSDLEQMSAGLETPIGERGVSISGGQKQRISLARAFIKDPQVLILDDALSAVDARTERVIIKNIQEERQDKTTIIVTHRLSAVNHADLVLVLDEGRIVERGRPDELLAQGGWYAQQYDRQQASEEE
ncbi:ABC transporter ATP-binding protein [Streptococcus caprae]|uniref:ABC transporter ATP-binding protein n=1 Tax=Streptococcus caprae TaxID=1640501 RepID=A0ABV8CT72_9STRE